MILCISVLYKNSINVNLSNSFICYVFNNNNRYSKILDKCLYISWLYRTPLSCRIDNTGHNKPKWCYNDY